MANLTSSPDDFEYTKEHAASAIVDEISDDDYTRDVIYLRKTRLLNGAMQDIGMGRYQWALFFVTGFGWYADNLWPVVASLIVPPVILEFSYTDGGAYMKLAEHLGLLIGAVFWGVGSDVWGRRLSFNLTLLIVSVFAMAAGGAPDYISLCAFVGAWSVGVGGNLPVDSAIFLEFTPASHQYLLTVLSVWWAVGQLVASLVAWPLIGNFSCPAGVACTRKDNQGWRYFVFAMGGTMFLMWIIRFFIFKLYESPKFFMARGHDDKAIDVLHAVAKFNRRPDAVKIGVDDLHAMNQGQDGSKEVMDTSIKARVRDRLSKLDASHVKDLFATRKLIYSTTLIIIIWGLIGLAFPLYSSFIVYYLSSRGTDFGDGSTNTTYRNQVILSVIGIPGAILAGYLVEVPVLGRRGTLSVSSLVTGAFILASTTARSSPALLGWNCAYTFSSNVMYGVLYAMTPELFPTKDRGTGNALASAANRICGVMAPIIALYADLTTSVPIYIAGVLFMAAGCLAILLPIESRGKAAS